MTLTKHKKQVRDERKVANPDNVCCSCGKSLKGSTHHFYCNDCWLPKYLRYDARYSKQAKKFMKNMN